MGGSVRPEPNDNPFKQPAGLALEPQQRRYSPENPFASPDETYSPDNPFAPSTIRHAPVVVSPPEHEPVVVTPDIGSSANPFRMAPAVVSDTAPSPRAPAAPAQPLRMPPAVVTAPLDAINAVSPMDGEVLLRKLRMAPGVPAVQPDASRVGPPPGSEGTPLAKMDFKTRVAGALLGPVVDPIGAVKGLAGQVTTANRAAAENDAAASIGLAGGDPSAVERTVSPVEAKNAAISTATLLAAPLAAEAEALLGSGLAPAVGSRLAGIVARTAVPATIGAGLMPSDPLVGAVAGGVAGAAHNELGGKPFRPTVRGMVTRDPSAMLPETTTPRAPIATGRVLSPDNPFAHEPDFTVETNPVPSAAPTQPPPAAPASAEPVAEATPVPGPVEAAKPSRTGDVIFEDGAKRFVDARTRAGGRRAPEKVSTDGLVAELSDVMQRRDDAVRRAQYENRLDENGHTKAAGDYVQVATRLGRGGPTEQAKALTNLDDANRIVDELTAELKARGLSDDDIYERLSAHGDMAEERAGLAEDYNAGRINSEVVRDEQGNVLFSPGKPTVAKPTGETDLFGEHVTEEVPAQTSMFDENAGTKLAQEDAAKLAKHTESIDADEMARRRDELGAPKQEIPGADEPDQGLLFDRAGTAPTGQGELPLDEPVDLGGTKQAGPASSRSGAGPAPKGGGITFTLRQISQRLASALSLPIRERYFPFARFKARGVYKTGPEVARVMDLQDLDVAAHEAGHHVGKMHLGGLDDAETQKILASHPGVETDLRRLGQDLYGPKAVDKHLQEGIAELFKWYVMDPAHLKVRAPNALRWLENDIFPKEGEIAKAFQQARGDFELFQKSPVDQKLAAMYAKRTPERSIADIRDAVGRFLRAKFTDDLGEFERLKKEGAVPARAQDDPYLLAMASRTDGAWVQNALNYGIPNATGRRVTVSYKSLLNRIPKGEATRYKNYLIAERLNEQASHTQTLVTPNGAKRVSDILTEAPQRLNHPGVVRALDAVVGRLTGHLETNPAGGTGKTVKAGLTYADVQKVVEDGRKDAKLAAWADDYWQFNHAVVGLLKDHVLTPSEVSRIVDANQKYVSFHRIFDEELGANVGGTGRAYPRNTPGLGRLKGSSRSIEDPLESPVLALYKAARMVHKHAAFEALVKLATHREGMGYIVEQVHNPVDAINLTVTKEVVDQLEAAGLDRQDAEALEGAKLVQYVARAFATAKNTRDMVLPALVKGKRRWFKIGDKRVWDAVQSMGAEEVPEWLRWMEIPARALRAGTTLVPGFSVGTNWWRDAFDAATYSKGSTRPPFYHFIRGLFHMAKQDAIFHMFELEGGDVGAQMLYDRQHLAGKLRDLSKNKALSGSTTVVRSPIDYAKALSALSRKYLFESWLHPLEKLASIPERATRIGETGLVYDELLKKAEANAKATGMPVTDQDKIDIRKRAAAAGREVTLNFVRGGTWVRQLNRLSVFLKPSVESAARFGRETHSRPFTIIARMMAWIGIPATIAYLAQRKDKDFQATPSWMRNTGFVFIEHNADGSFKHRWYFPAPNLEWWLWGVVPQRVMQWMDTKNPAALNEIATSLVENVKPSLTPTFAVPMIENDRNRSFFGDRPIEPSGLEALEPGYRATPETGETARLIGKETGYSPAKFENLVRGYTGGLGETALRASDKAVHAVKGALGKPEEVNSIRDIDPLHNTPVLGRFERGQGSAMSSAWVQQFYDTWIKNNEYRSTLISLRKAGRDDEADRYLDEHQAAIATVATAEELHPHNREAKPGPFRQAHDALTELRQKMDALSRDKLSPEEYRAQVTEVNEQMLMVARRALEAAGVKVMPAGSPEP